MIMLCAKSTFIAIKEIIMKEQKPKYYPLLDFLKLFAAFMVVTIHVGRNIGPLENFAAIRRFAVPFFIIITGYFLYAADHKKQTAKFANLFKKMVWLNVIWGLVYFVPYVILKENGNFLKFITNFNINFNNIVKQVPLISEYAYEHGHLWYITALIVAAGVLYLLSRYLPEKVFKIILHLLPLLLIQGILVFRLKFFYNIDTHYYDYRNAWFATLPFLAIGMLFRKYYMETKIGDIILLLLIIPLWCFNIIEVQKGLDFSISGSLLAIIFFSLAITKYNANINNKIVVACSRFAGSASAFIFFAHIFFREYFLHNPHNKVPQDKQAYVAFSICLIIYLVYYLVKKLIVKRKTHEKNTVLVS